MTPLSLLGEGGKCPRREAARERGLRCHGGPGAPQTPTRGAAQRRGQGAGAGIGLQGLHQKPGTALGPSSQPRVGEGPGGPCWHCPATRGAALGPRPFAEEISAPFWLLGGRAACASSPSLPGVSFVPLHPLHPAGHGEVSSSAGRFSISPTARFFPSADPGGLTGAGQE